MGVWTAPQVGLWGQAVEGLTAGGWVWLGEEKEGAGATRDRAPLRFRCAVRAVSPSPVLGQACGSSLSLALARGGGVRRERQPTLLGSGPSLTILSSDFHSLWSVQWKVPQAQLALRAPTLPQGCDLVG